MRPAVIILAAFLAVSACARSERSQANAADKVDESLTGWLAADAPGETALIYRAAPGAPDVALSCLQGSRSFRVVAPNPDQPPPRTGDKATLYLGGTSFETTVTGSARGEPQTLALETEITDQLLDAMRRARSVRLVYRSEVTRIGDDPGEALAQFAEGCAAIAGLTPAG